MNWGSNPFPPGNSHPDRPNNCGSRRRYIPFYSSHSSVTTLRTAIHLLLTYLLTYYASQPAGRYPPNGSWPWSNTRFLGHTWLHTPKRHLDRVGLTDMTNRQTHTDHGAMAAVGRITFCTARCLVKITHACISQASLINNEPATLQERRRQFNYGQLSSTTLRKHSLPIYLVNILH